MLNEPKKQADVLELLMLGVEIGFWEATMKPDDQFAPTTPDTPDLTTRLGNRIGTLTTPEGDAGKAIFGIKPLMIGAVLEIVLKAIHFLSL